MRSFNLLRLERVHFSISKTSKTKQNFKALLCGAAEEEFMPAAINVSFPFLCHRNVPRQFFAILSLHSRCIWDNHESYNFFYEFLRYLLLLQLEDGGRENILMLGN